jgi:hypothetical protein
MVPVSSHRPALSPPRALHPIRLDSHHLVSSSEHSIVDTGRTISCTESHYLTLCTPSFRLSESPRVDFHAEARHATRRAILQFAVCTPRMPQKNPMLFFRDQNRWTNWWRKRRPCRSVVTNLRIPRLLPESFATTSKRWVRLMHSGKPFLTMLRQLA